MEIINNKDSKSTEKLIEEMVLSSTEKGGELVEEYKKSKEKLERNESLSAIESIKLLELIKANIEEYKEQISGIKEHKKIFLFLNSVIKVISVFYGEERQVHRNWADVERTIVKNIFPNIEKVEQTIEDTKDNLDNKKVENTIAVYKEIVKYSNLIFSTPSKSSNKLTKEDLEDIERISTELKETQEKINQLTYKPKRGGLYGFRKK